MSPEELLSYYLHNSVSEDTISDFLMGFRLLEDQTSKVLKYSIENNRLGIVWKLFFYQNLTKNHILYIMKYSKCNFLHKACINIIKASKNESEFILQNTRTGQLF